jgi:Protein of unknown function (DUF2842)
VSPTAATVQAMPIRLRKFIGAVALFVLVIVWALVAMALAQAPVIHDSTFASIAYYVIAGIGWVLPAMPLVRWMSTSQGAEASNK